MKINLKKVKERLILEDVGEIDTYLLYLLGVAYDLNSFFIPPSYGTDMEEFNIIIRFNEKEKINPEYLEEEIVSPFDWVKEEYIALFEKIGKGGHVKESVIRMKKLFTENPDIRKKEVLKATFAYLSNTDIKYVREPHYFIEKGVGTSKTYDLLNWIYKVREKEEIEESIIEGFNPNKAKV
ncbi:MAG: hypothetical protein ACRC0V_01625 [Fusobacteriaceae bacterium]